MPAVRLLFAVALAASVLVSVDTAPVAAELDTVSLLVSGPAAVPAELTEELEPEIDVESSASLPRLDTTVVEVAADDAAEAIDRLDDIAGVNDVIVDPVLTAQVVPNDPNWISQWGVRSVRGDLAWDQTTGSADVLIAVIDTGVDRVADLGGRVRAGKDYVNNDLDPSDDNGHGTDVATIAAGTGDDNTGVAGLCWRCQLLPVKVLDASGSGFTSDIAAGIVWATDQGADVINLSLGGPTNSAALTDAIDYAVGQGAVVVAAAGNDGSTSRTYPGATANAIGVAAIDSNDAKYSWSNSGTTWVDVAARGCNPATGSGAMRVFCGTSSATPVVAGLAGLIRSEHPSLGSHDVRAALESGAVVKAGGPSAHGKVDGPRSLAEADQPGSAQPVPPPKPPAPAPDRERPIGWILPPKSILDGVARIEVAAADNRAVRSVQLLADGQVVGAAKPNADFIASFDWSTGAQRDRIVMLEAIITDTSGNATRTAVQPGVVDNFAPWHIVLGPEHDSRVGRRVNVSLAVWDGNGSKFSLLVAEGRFVGLAIGDGVFEFDVELRGRGPTEIAAIGIDHFGHVGISNRVTVWR
jgi:subtilisin family serine protease